jgi:GT2 family glycosyltransferase
VSNPEAVKGEAASSRSGPASPLGVVVIGRNEGERLERCLRSVVGRGSPVVYVDSGSSDGSPERAHALGIEVVDLDTPYCAARARNAGFERIVRCNPTIELVQFVDGDCELIDGWLEAGRSEIERHHRAAVVFGKLRERYPSASIYNQICDLEWDTPVGEVLACGGVAMVRASAFRTVGGFNPEMVAGEEPELCVRLRRAGGEVWRVDADMAWHDAAIERFSQWWRRMLRGGHAYGDAFWRHGFGPERHALRPVLSAVFWGLFLPTAAVVPAWSTDGLSLALLLLYPVQGWRVYLGQRRLGRAKDLAAAYSGLMLVAKFAEAFGALRFACLNMFGRTGGIIEYKRPENP